MSQQSQNKSMDRTKEYDSDRSGTNTRTNVGCYDIIVAEEQLLSKAAVHIEQTQVQRVLEYLTIEQIKFANVDDCTSLFKEKQVQTIIIDYCQNLSLRHLGTDHPDTFSSVDLLLWNLQHWYWLSYSLCARQIRGLRR